ncbi:hypothetical protein ACLOJK_017574 [Asimina triloba]
MSVYKGIPALSESNQMRSMTAVLDDSLSSSSDSLSSSSDEKEATTLMPEGNNSGIEENDQKLKTAERILRLPCMDAWVVYLKQDVVLPGVALALLYFSILSFGTLMTASLEWKVGLSAASRLGLWMFDLAVIQQMQDHVPETDRCVVGGVQNSLQAMLVLMTYILGMFISDPKDFGTLDISLLSLVGSAICTPLSDRLHLKIEILVTQESEPVLEDGKLYKSQS